MSEVKFACPHCAQHILCDDAWCANPIACPACGKELFVPRLATFPQTQPGKLALAVPVAAKARFEPRAPDLHVWTPKEWDRHAAAVTGEIPDPQPIIWFFLVMPFAIALILIARGVQFPAILTCFVLNAMMAGFVWAHNRKFRGIRLLLAGVGCAATVLVGYGALAVAILVAGCSLL